MKRERIIKDIARTREIIKRKYNALKQQTRAKSRTGFCENI